MHRLARCVIVSLAALVTAQMQAAAGQTAPAAGVVATRKPEKLHDDAHLHNVYRIHEKVLSGGQPYGDEGFKTLKSLGVKTLISVDGAKPDVALAKKHGLRYVHLPHGYDGVPEGRGRELAKAVRELDGPVYIHCHHGKHRSPAAAAVACVSAGLISPDSALPILAAAGTSKSYRGLYKSAAEARPIDLSVLDALKVRYPEVAEVPAMADAMVEIEHRHDALMQIAANGWQSLPDHPDVVPGHEALLLREHLMELLRTDDVKAQPEAFRELLKQGEQRAQALEDSYRAWEASKTASAGAADGLTRVNVALDAVSQNCAACHTQFRDVPLHEKGKR